MSLLSELSELAGAAFVAAGLPASLGEVVVSQRAELAQFQCNGALAGAAQAERSPRDIAEEVADRLRSDLRISKA
ncbi:MAG: arginine--tRNA ligase, partial [Acidimicrobiia bacterium]|nr:arginine--tRNA ligase [Acidimicrobiia bacterium]